MPPRETCDWCGKAKHEVNQLIVGGGQTPLRKKYMRPDLPLPETGICSECVGLLAVIMATEHPDWRNQILAKFAEIATSRDPDPN